MYFTLHCTVHFTLLHTAMYTQLFFTTQYPTFYFTSLHTALPGLQLQPVVSYLDEPIEPGYGETFYIKHLPCIFNHKGTKYWFPILSDLNAVLAERNHLKIATDNNQVMTICWFKHNIALVNITLVDIACQWPDQYNCNDGLNHSCNSNKRI